jgi:hypothetical protein
MHIFKKLSYEVQIMESKHSKERELAGRTNISRIKADIKFVLEVSAQGFHFPIGCSLSQLHKKCFCCSVPNKLSSDWIQCGGGGLQSAIFTDSIYFYVLYEICNVASIVPFSRPWQSVYREFSELLSLCSYIAEYRLVTKFWTTGKYINYGNIEG